MSKSITDDRKIKGLRSQVAKMIGDIDSLKIYISDKQKELNNKLSRAHEIMDKITELEKGKSKTNVMVSEHAIVRYFERVKGFDISEIKKEIVTEDVLKLVDTLGGNGSYPNKDFKVKMKNFTVTTVV